MDWAQISAAVGAVIRENSGTGLLKNMTNQGIFVVTCPGNPIVMTPPQAHMQVEVLFKAGMAPIMQVGEPGVQGAVTGMQGIGVRTPSAAAVAAATVGLAIDMHIANGGILTIGAQSMIVAAGAPAMVLFVGSTFRVEGAMPKVHIIMAPVVTSWGI